MLFLLAVFTQSVTFAQNRVVTAGFEFKPVFSSDFFNTGPQSLTWDQDYFNDSIPAQLIHSDSAGFRITPTSGYCMGMVIRKGLSNKWSLETGITFVRRNYKLQITDSSGTGSGSFKMVSYEIPLQGLVFIQMSDHIYMDVSMGSALCFYPSDVATAGMGFLQSSVRRSWYGVSLLANIGWEYRTAESGYFYLGASYNRPFNYIYRSFFKRFDSDYGPSEYIDLKGNYLTIDLKYFFHADPQRRKSSKNEGGD